MLSQFKVTLLLNKTKLNNRYPIVRAEEIILPSPEGELACLVDATIRFPPSALDSSRDVKENEVESDEGREVDFLVTHFGVWEDPLDRELQVFFLCFLFFFKKFLCVLFCVLCVWLFVLLLFFLFFSFLF